MTAGGPSTPTEGCEAVTDIGVPRINLGDPLEEVARPRNVPRTVVQITDDVPLLEVIVANSLGSVGDAEQELQGAGEIALIGQGSGSNDPALRHHLWRRRTLTNLTPDLVDLAVPAHRPKAVSKNWQLRRCGMQRPRLLQLGHRFAPLAEAVMSNTRYFVSSPDVR